MHSLSLSLSCSLHSLKLVMLRRQANSYAPSVLRQLFLRQFCSQEQPTLYQVLGVSATADKDDIKRAFRQKAKQLHPDIVSETQAHAFARTLQAYQVLIDDHERQLYDLSIQSRAGRILHSAAAADPNNSSWGNGDGDLRWGWGLGAFAAADSVATANNSQVDRLRGHLRGNLRTALRQAYFGPSVDVLRGQLPPCFEAEERSQPGVGDVLQLVSGRQLLGAVRERTSSLLHQPPTRQHVGPQHRAALSGVPDHSPETPASSVPSSGAATAGAQPDKARRSSVDAACTLCQSNASFGSQRSSSPCQEKQQEQEQEQQQQSGGTPKQAKVLELVVGDEVVAVGVQRLEGSSRMEVYREHKLIATCERDKVVSMGGQLAHTILQGQTPLVRFLYFTTRLKGKRVTVCRCRRAWLPPSATWLFPPRNPTHSTGGYYFEWTGYAAAQHLAWLDPAIFVLRAGFDTLAREQERLKAEEAAVQQRRPWERVLTRPADAGGLKAWLKDILAFHGFRRPK